MCTLVCDDSEDISFSAKEFLESLFMLDAKHLAEDEVAEIFSRLVPWKLFMDKKRTFHFCEGPELSHAFKSGSWRNFQGWC